MITEERKLKETLSYVSAIFNSCRDIEDRGAKWFLSFGTMLYYFRDRHKSKPYEQDIDVSVFYDEVDGVSLRKRFETFSYKQTARMVDDVDHKPLHLSFMPGKDITDRVLDVSIDVFFWYRHGDYCYHTYGETDKNGIPSKYVLKGMPKSLLRGAPVKYYWFEDSFPVQFPVMYGSCLDYWYPGWFIPDRNFGQSKTEALVEVKSFKDLNNDKIVLPQISRSKEEYQAYLDSLCNKQTSV